MTELDIKLEELYKAIPDKPKDKNDESITKWDRNVYLYDRDEVARQADAVERNGTGNYSYANHRQAVETAVNMLHKNTSHDIAMCILTHRFFKDYRNTVFAGEGTFYSDYTFVIKKIEMLFNNTTNRLVTVNISSKLAAFGKPTLVQVNHIMGIVKPVTIPTTLGTLQQSAHKLNLGAPESTTYMIAGMQLGNAQ